jgi:N4-gp56 family major capsid protein
MTMQTYKLTPARIDRYKGAILKHATPSEILCKVGRQRPMPVNSSETYIARRWLPYGATATNANTANQFFGNGTGDRGNLIVQAHLTQEGLTPQPDSIIAQDVVVVMQQYSCLYGFTDKTFYLYEDDIPKEMITQVGERMTFVNELIVYGTLKGCTNQFFGGIGTSRATVNGGLSLGLLRKVAKSMMANHAEMVTDVLEASNKYATSPVSKGYFVYVHTDLEPDIRDLPNFTPVEKYASGTSMPMEIGSCERFRFIGHPDLPSFQDAGATVGATGLSSTTGTNIDVYPIIVTAKDAWSQIMLRGKESLKPVYLPPGEASKPDPFGQRGYAGAMWWKAAMVENNGWMAVVNVGVRTLI